MTALATRHPQVAPQGRLAAAHQASAGQGNTTGSGGTGRQARYGNEFLKQRLATRAAHEGSESASKAPGAEGPAPEEATAGTTGGAGRGPFAGAWLNEALAAAFGRDLGGLDASFGEGRANSAIGAAAHTEGAAMSFGAGVREDANDAGAMEIVAHETAHALAGGGAGATALDAPGDAGEQAAETAGRGFRKWAEAGFEGPAPRLAPARGGRAKVHRVTSGSSATLTGTPLLRQGSRGAAVSTLQTLLNTHGASLLVDGIFGDHTDNAVRSYQHRHGLEVDGVVGPRTAAALSSGAAATPAASSGGSGHASDDDTTYAVSGSPMLRTGSTGALVRTLQGLLNHKGAHLDVDGTFGQNTDIAVRGFQSANHLEVDGIVGRATARALNDSGSSHIAATPAATHFAGTDAYTDIRDAVLDAAKSHLGAPYYWGADGPSMFDCSGFILYVLRQDTGLVSWGDDTAGGIKARLPSTNNPRKGDLNFYSTSSGVEHIEMFTGSGSTEIGASGGGSHTFGHDPDAKVQYSDSAADGRSLSHGSIAGLIAAKQARR